MIIEKLIKRNSKGIYNVCSDQIISKYDFGLKLTDVFNYDSKYLVKTSIKENKHLITRPVNMTLSNSKLKKKLNIKKIDINNSINKFYKSCSLI